MSKLGKAALILGSIFLVFVIMGGVITAVGVADLANKADFLGKLENVFEEYGVNGGPIHIGGYDDGDYVDTEASWEVSCSDSVAVIELSKIACSAVIRKGDEGKVSLNYNGKVLAGLGKEPIDIVWEDEKITISGNDTGKNKWGSNYGEMEIVIPESFGGELVFNDAAAEIKMNDLELTGLSLNNTAGEIEAENCEIMQLDITNSLGEIKLNGRIGCFNIKSAMAEIDLELDKPLAKNCLISDCMGEVNVKLPEGSNVDLKSNNSLGTVKIDGVPGNGKAIVVNVNDCLGTVVVEIDD